MDRPGAAFRAAAEAAQAGAGIIAARHRGDLANADALLEGIDDKHKAAGFLLLADLVVALLAQAEGRTVDEVTAEVSLQIAAQVSSS